MADPIDIYGDMFPGQNFQEQLPPESPEAKSERLLRERRQALMDEAGQMYPKDFPEQSRLSGHMLNPFSRSYKTPTQYLNDQRRAYVLERLNPKNKGTKTMRELQGSYEKRNFLDPDMVGGAALDWAGSAPSMMYGLGQGLANQTDKAVSSVLGQESVTPYPDGMQNAARSAMNLLEPVVGTGEMVDYYLGGELPSWGKGGKDDYVPGLQAKALRVKDEKANVPHTTLDPRQEYAAIDAKSEADNPIKEGYEYLTEANIPELENTTAGYVAKKVLGTGMDGAFDMFAPLGFARAWGKPMVQGLRSLASDFGPDAMFEGGMSVFDWIRRQQKEREERESSQNR